MVETTAYQLNHWLILSRKHDPDDSRGTSSVQVTNYVNKKQGRTRMFFVVLLTLVVGIPIIVQAGFFSFITRILVIVQANETYVATASLAPNSQTMTLLEAALNHDPNPSKGGGGIIVVGRTALLPNDGPSGTLANIEERPPSSDQISIYVVREGDSLSQIAEMFNVTTNTIVWGNDIKRGSLISPGQILVILPISGIQHIVKKGDTLKSIAKKYKGDIDEIANYNDLGVEALLAVGDMITIPDGEIEAPKYSPSSASRVVQGSGGPEYSGYYLRPLLGGRKTQGLHGYNGIDMGAPYNTPILASAAGSVIISRGTGWNGGYGKYIVVRHPNGTQTLYAHNNRNIVYQGESVVRGQVIGYVGSSGRSTGPHLHFEIRGARNPF